LENISINLLELITQQGISKWQQKWKNVVV